MYFVHWYELLKTVLCRQVYFIIFLLLMVQHIICTCIITLFFFSGISSWPVNTTRATPTGRRATPLTGTPRMWGLPGTLWVSCLYSESQTWGQSMFWVRFVDNQCCWATLEDNRCFGSDLWTINVVELDLRTATCSKSCWVTLEDNQRWWVRLENNRFCWVRLEDNWCCWVRIEDN